MASPISSVLMPYKNREPAPSRIGEFLTKTGAFTFESLTRKDNEDVLVDDFGLE